MDIAYFVVNLYLLCMKHFVTVVNFSLMFVCENCRGFFETAVIAVLCE